VKDGLISDPERCHFDPSVLACHGDDGPTCLTARQVETAKTLMSPLRQSGSGAEIFPGWEPGAELGWRAIIGGPVPTTLSTDHYRYVVFNNPTWDWKTFDAERDIALALKADDHETVDVIQPDITRFAARGGKMLMYHGWTDPLVPPRASINKLVQLQQNLGGADKATQSVRLFMVPGMGHCGGGEGPNAFDMIGALERWVEHRGAPTHIIASHVNERRVDRTRPLCPYPQFARYTGSGSIDDASNFVCR